MVSISFRLVLYKLYSQWSLQPEAHHGSTEKLYGYVPTEWICALFIALFSLTTSQSGRVHVASYIKWLADTLSLLQ